MAAAAAARSRMWLLDAWLRKRGRSSAGAEPLKSRNRGLSQEVAGLVWDVSDWKVKAGMDGEWVILFENSRDSKVGVFIEEEKIADIGARKALWN